MDGTSQAKSQAIAERLEASRARYGVYVSAMAKMVGLPKSRYVDIRDGAALTETDVPPLASWLEISEKEVKEKYFPKPEPEETPRPSRRLGSVSLVPTNALGELLEKTRTERNSTLLAMVSRLHISQSAYEQAATGTLTETLKKKVFQKIEQTLPGLSGERISPEKIRELYATPLQKQELHAAGKPISSPDKPIERS